MDHWGASAAVSCDDGATYLLDAGEPLGPSIITNAVNEFYGFSRSKENVRRDLHWHLDIYSIRAVFVSHLHADHLSGLPMFLQNASLFQSRDESFRFGNDNSLEIYLPRMGISVFREWLEVLGLGQPKYTLIIKPVAEGAFYDDGSIQVTAVHNNHRLGSSFSFLVHGEGKTLAYSGDIALRDLRETDLLTQPIDLLVVECAHFKPQELFESLRGLQIKKVVVSHIHPGLYGRTREVLSMGREVLGRRVRVGEDGMVVNV